MLESQPCRRRMPSNPRWPVRVDILMAFGFVTRSGADEEADEPCSRRNASHSSSSFFPSPADLFGGPPTLSRSFDRSVRICCGSATCEKIGDRWIPVGRWRYDVTKPAFRARSWGRRPRTVESRGPRFHFLYCLQEEAVDGSAFLTRQLTSGKWASSWTTNNKIVTRGRSPAVGEVQSSLSEVDKESCG